MESDPKKIAAFVIMCIAYVILSAVTIYSVILSDNVVSPAVGVAAIIGMVILSIIARNSSRRDKSAPLAV